MALKRLFGPAALTGAAADTYTVPAGRKATVRHIRVVNGTAAAINFTGSIGVDAAATRGIADAKSVPAFDYIDIFGLFPLAAAEKIQAFGLNLVLEMAGDEDVA